MTYATSVLAAILIGLYLFDRYQRRRAMRASLRLILGGKDIEEAKRELRKLNEFRAFKKKEADDAKAAYDRDYRSGNRPDDDNDSPPSAG